MKRTLFDKVWDDHIVSGDGDDPDLLFVDLHLVHEVTSPQAFEGLRISNRSVRRPDLTLATADHGTPTIDRALGIKDPLSRLQVETLLAVVRDVIGSIYGSGFRRVLIVNGHGGNAAVGSLSRELMAERPGMSIKFHSWWSGPEVMAKAKELEPDATHANWFENFPWTRLAGVELPKQRKPLVDMHRLQLSSPAQARELLGDGTYGAAYQISDTAMQTSRHVVNGIWILKRPASISTSPGNRNNGTFNWPRCA